MTLIRTISNLATPTTLVNGGDVTIPDNELLTLFNNLINGVDSLEKFRFDPISTPSAPSAGKFYLYATTGGLKVIDSSSVVTDLMGKNHARCDGRLTLTSGTAVTNTDVSAATTVYFTPYNGNSIWVYDGTVWVPFTLSEISLSLAAYAADTNYDIFVYSNAGTLTLESTAWSTSTARATALTTQGGVYVKSGATTRRYLGTIRTTATIGQCEDSVLKRYVWNVNNRVQRVFTVVDTTDSWTYTGTTLRQWNNSNNNRVGFVRGLNEDPVWLVFNGSAAVAAAVAQVAIGLDSTTTASGLYTRSASATLAGLIAQYIGTPSAGFHFLQLLEYASAATVTFYGDFGVGTPPVSAGAHGLLAA